MACVVFALVAVAHFVRLVANIGVVIGGSILPMWLSGVALLVTAVLAVWMWWLASRLRHHELPPSVVATHAS